MLFNSVNFILLFLPVVVIIYYFLLKKHLILASKTFLICASLVFYSAWNYKYLALLLISLLVNFTIGSSLNSDFKAKISSKTILIFGILFNLVVLGYYKYTNFVIDNLNLIFRLNISDKNILLPLAISFFTFQQITYLVDSYKKLTKEYDFLNYTLFVTFFPQLIAGPIVHHLEMMPQFNSLKTKVLSHKNLFIGTGIFLFGLTKKVILADTLATCANQGFEPNATLTCLEAWITSLSYTFQLYFDFSGYSDMAIGLAMLFNIVLPFNFNNPYVSLNIQDFWRKWHITLSRFLRDYIYIPLGGSRNGKNRTLVNIMITFLLGGLWHGAGWTFVFWGLLHGVALCIFNLWSRLKIKLNTFSAWFITFNFVNIAWVFFRSETFNDAIKIIKSMFGFSGFALPKFRHFDVYSDYIHCSDLVLIMLVLSFALIFLFKKNIDNIKPLLKPNWCTLIVFIAVTTLNILIIIRNTQTPFLYFNF